MLELKTKWFTNSLAKQSMANNDYILCHDNNRVYILGYGRMTSSAKNTYNLELRDANENVLASYENLYIDAITNLILGVSPKSKANKDANKDANESKHKQTKQVSKQGNKESLLLTFDEAFEKACNMIESYKDIAKMLGKYNTKDASLLALYIIKEANESEAKRIKEAKKNEELNALRLSLDIAKEQGNTMLVDAIQTMISNKEKE